MEHFPPRLRAMAQFPPRPSWLDVVNSAGKPCSRIFHHPTAAEKPRAIKRRLWKVRRHPPHLGALAIFRVRVTAWHTVFVLIQEPPARPALWVVSNRLQIR